ncbi:MAG: hypothetical protein QNI84_12735 [Henriciella sp.]|nr:hypothetical protein [Henriciella sp.]
MSLFKAIAASVAFAALAACATSTPYQAADGGKRGYTNQQIESDRWRVTFNGNSLTDRETVETYLLYRAAELTDQEGYDYFRVVQRETDAERRLVETGFGADPFYSHFYCDYRFYGRAGRLYGYPRGFYGRSRLGYRGHYYHDPFWGHSYDVREIVRYEAIAEIKLGRGEKPDDAAYFNADEVLMNLAGRIQRPEA